MTEKVFITGGTGTLGKAILRTADAERWKQSFTIYSRDPLKQLNMPRYEHIEVNYIMGDILDFEGLSRAMVGHDTVIHAAAMKHIPQGQEMPSYTYQVNVQGSYNVAQAALLNRVKVCVGISTDKAAAPCNVYGASKMLMENIFIEFSRLTENTRYTLCRYGNVLGSNGSVLQVWARQLADGNKITITNPDMTRFWLTEEQAVNIIDYASSAQSGVIVIPDAPAMDIGTMANLVAGRELTADDMTIIDLRPGERMHEFLLTFEEASRARKIHNYIHLYPSGVEVSNPLREAVMSSRSATSEELIEIAKKWGRIYE